MQFHHHGYVSTQPRVQPAAGTGLNRSEELPDTMDVLIVGSGPAGMTTAATLSCYPDVHTRLVERRDGRLELGQADGIQARSVETFNYFGFSDEITNEAYWLTEMNFWTPDEQNPENICRTSRELDDPTGISEFKHLVVNQARVLDYFAEFAERSPSRLKPDYGYEFVSQHVDETHDYPIEVALKITAGPHEGNIRRVRTKYLIGSDGAHSKVRKSIGRVPIGDKSNHAWGVMDVLVESNFPDIRTKCSIHSHDGGSILLIPREGGFLVRFYVDLGDVDPDDGGKVRETPLEEIIHRANKILHPYTVDVKEVAWWSVYEVGHRVTDKFDDVDASQEDEKNPRIFITGDACHTHSAKAGQGMNVSIQDGFNLGWKIGQVLSGYSAPALLHTYSGERQEIAQNLIDFDKEWSSLMATKPEDLPSPDYVAKFYTKTFEFPSGFMTEYKPSPLTTDNAHQDLAQGYTIGKRFKSAKVSRVSDTNPVELGHLHKADGRWRIYVFGDDKAATDIANGANTFGEWLGSGTNSPILKYTRNGCDINSVFDVKVIYQQPKEEIELMETPSIFRPVVGPFHITDLNQVFGILPDDSIFDTREISKDGAVVVVRPDGYVSTVQPLAATGAIAELFDGIFTPQN
ncbi:MAG TPA: FAD-dependent monooxygenase [Enteractinococcus helveticum]|uniref:FAD-dependent monooxygenase n=1 Tax=Enteractinococcus helveticum TaxID=1837282 RepID=A0A921FR43_9MICC|nr:FAD-dependent monooxygenase [Enteractinococcus helveticum]HJF15957.1 FAD-dependent monooxygenase [Enteractinococcus helveticum]